MPGPPAHPMPNPALLIPQKRRLPSHEGAPSQAEARHRALPPTASGTTHQERGRVTCETCREAISFKDEDGAFTLQHWDAHRLKCESSGDAPPPPPDRAASPPPMDKPAELSMDSQHSTNAGPPPKRRRAKRTEEERIEYLRSDPFVAQFEAYRVLCGSCNKWIRLRPNSTYCSIPWDSHRKSCLAKNGKLNNIVPQSHARPATANSTSRATVPTRLPPAPALTTSKSATRSDIDSLEDADGEFEDEIEGHEDYPPTSVHQSSAARASSHRAGHVSTVPGSMPPPPYLSPSSRRRSLSHYDSGDHWSPGSRHARLAGHSAPSFPPHAFAVPPALASPDVLRSPASRPQSPREAGLTGSASPRTSSATDRGKLTEESDGRRHSSPTGSDRSADVGERGLKVGGRRDEERLAALRTDSLLGGVEPHQVFCLLCEKWVPLRQGLAYDVRPWLQHRGECIEQYNRRLETTADTARHHADGIRQRPSRTKNENVDHDVRMKDEDLADHHIVASRRPQHIHISPSTGRLADLDSPTGRLDFIAKSVGYLYATTYEPTDELPLPVLATYLNAAMPPEKHEEFDAVEVQRAIQDMPSHFLHLPLRLGQGTDGVMYLTTN